MLTTDQAALQEIQPELTAGERVLWAAQPRPGFVLRSSDGIKIPFSLVWGGFAIFWELGVLGVFNKSSHGTFHFDIFMIWGIPFVLAGQYMIWGRFLFESWIKKRTFYAVTNLRVIAVQNSFTRRTTSNYIDSLPALTKEASSGRHGSLKFREDPNAWIRGQGSAFWNEFSVLDGPRFLDIDEVDSVYNLVAELRKTAARTPD
ncbi:hypothetical protein [Paludibaculum fermentans]|uniref:hypothetical protein n=1 Tax=Paludibaculum fermentans TaxID=1473598 RepID=UPI003EB6EE70